MWGLALLVLAVCLVTPAVAGLLSLHRILRADDSPWALLPRLDLPLLGTSGINATLESGRRRLQTSCAQSTASVQNITGVPHPYVYEVSGLGPRVLLHGTIHVSTQLLYGGEDGIPDEISQVLADADSVFTEIDLDGRSMCDADEDGMGSPDCSDFLSSTAAAPAARHFAAAERGRIAAVLETGPPRSRPGQQYDMQRNLSDAWEGSACDLPQWIEREFPTSFGYSSEAEMRLQWERYPACIRSENACDPIMPWRSVINWRVLDLVWWLTMLDSQSTPVSLWRAMLELSNHYQRKVLLDLVRDDLLWDAFIATRNNASERSGVEDETRCGVWNEEHRSASEQLGDMLPCFEDGVNCVRAVGVSQPSVAVQEDAQAYRCSEWTSGRYPRTIRRTGIMFRRNSQMVSQIVRLASERQSDTTLLFAFGLAHFEITWPSVISMLCERGYQVTHLPTGRDRCTTSRVFEEEAIELAPCTTTCRSFRWDCETECGQGILLPMGQPVRWNANADVELKCEQSEYGQQVVMYGLFTTDPHRGMRLQDGDIQDLGGLMQVSYPPGTRCPDTYDPPACVGNPYSEECAEERAKAERETQEVWAFGVVVVVLGIGFGRWHSQKIKRDMGIESAAQKRAKLERKRRSRERQNGVEADAPASKLSEETALYVRAVLCVLLGIVGALLLLHWHREGKLDNIGNGFVGLLAIIFVVGGAVFAVGFVFNCVEGGTDIAGAHTRGGTSTRANAAAVINLANGSNTRGGNSTWGNATAVISLTNGSTRTTSGTDNGDTVQFENPMLSTGEEADDLEDVATPAE